MVIDNMFSNFVRGLKFLHLVTLWRTNHLFQDAATVSSIKTECIYDNNILNLIMTTGKC